MGNNGMPGYHKWTLQKDTINSAIAEKLLGALVIVSKRFGRQTLDLTMRSEPGLGTIAVDRRYLSYDPAFVATRDVADLAEDIIHEVAHAIAKRAREYDYLTEATRKRGF